MSFQRPSKKVKVETFRLARRPLVGLLSALLTISFTSFFAPAALANAPDGSGVTIAVIDFSGIDSASPELAGVIVHEVCLDAMAGIAPAGTYGVHCPNNQPIDEEPGAAGTSFTASGAQEYSGGGHGTAVASVIAGKTVGVAKGVKIVAIRNLHSESSSFQWVHDNAKKYNISAVVMSAGVLVATDNRSYKPCSQARETVRGNDFPLGPFIDALRAEAIAVFFSAGNDGSTGNVDEPACINGVFSVGATDGNSIASYSNISPEVSILAPGTNMVSTTGAKGTFTITSQQGTSFANPYAAAVYAKVKGLYPNLTPDQILAAMRTTGTLVDDKKVKSIPAVNEQALFAFLSSGKTIPDLASTFTVQKGSYSTGNNDALTAQNDALAQQVKTLQTETDKLAAANKTLTDQLAASQSAQADLAALQTKLGALQTSYAKLAAQLDTAKKKSASALSTKTLLCSRNGALKKISGAKPTCPTGWKALGYLPK